jgi:hypothetical protein
MASWAEIESSLPPAALAALKAAQAMKNTTTFSSTSSNNNNTPATETKKETDSTYLYDKELLSLQETFHLQSTQQYLLAETPADSLLDTIQKDGVVRINNVLPSHLCDALKQKVNQELEARVSILEADGFQASQAQSPGGFGRVYSRQNRYDLYVRNKGIYAECFKYLMEHSVGDFFRSLFAQGAAAKKNQHNVMVPSVALHPSMETLAKTERNASGVVANETIDASLWEYSTMNSDPGSPRQPIHPDNSWTKQPVLYTAFIALQDIDEDMGPTLFLPGTQSQESHQIFLGGDVEKRNHFLKNQVKYVTSQLRKGDAQIMDSRILHAGLDNRSKTGKRRTLFYFTMRNPNADPRDFVAVPKGSIYSDVNIKLEDYTSATH